MNEKEYLESLTLNLIGDDERGYDFITDAGVQVLKELQTEEPRIFSLYLDISPERIQHEPAPIRYRHLVERVAESIEDKENRRMFQAVADDIGAMLLNEYNLMRGKGLVIFAAPEKYSPKGRREVKYETMVRYHLPAPPKDDLQWGALPVLTPLLVQIDENEPTGVILVDRQRARYFVYYMGEAAEYSVMEYDPTPQKTRALGYGAHNHEQWLEEKYRAHLRHTVHVADRLNQLADWKWIAVGGTDQTPEDLVELLPKHLKQKLLDTFQIDVDANYNQVRDEVAPIVHQAEVQEERAFLERWIGELERRGERAVFGLADTTFALQQGRIDTLITQPYFEHKGWQCQDCGGLVADLMDQPPSQCPYCGGELATVPDIVTLAAAQTLEHSGHVEVVRDPENQKLLEKYGNFGAILRF